MFCFFYYYCIVVVVEPREYELLLVGVRTCKAGAAHGTARPGSFRMEYTKIRGNRVIASA